MMCIIYCAERWYLWSSGLTEMKESFSSPLKGNSVGKIFKKVKTLKKKLHANFWIQGQFLPPPWQDRLPCHFYHIFSAEIEIVSLFQCEACSISSIIAVIFKYNDMSSTFNSVWDTTNHFLQMFLSHRGLSFPTLQRRKLCYMSSTEKQTADSSKALPVVLSA